MRSRFEHNNEAQELFTRSAPISVDDTDLERFRSVKTFDEWLSRMADNELAYKKYLMEICIKLLGANANSGRLDPNLLAMHMALERETSVRGMERLAESLDRYISEHDLSHAL